MRVRFEHVRFVCWAVAVLAALLIVGCGGGLRLGPGPTPTPNPGSEGVAPPGPSEAARFTVDVTTGKVTVAQTTHTAGTVSPQAVYLNPAVSFTTTDLLTQTGDLGRRKIVATMTNNNHEALGRQDQGFRVVFSDIVNVPPFMDLRPYSQVGMWCKVAGSPPWVAVAGPDASNNFYVASGNGILRVNGGTATQFAGQSATPGFTDGAGTAARFSNPQGLCLAGTILYVADTDNDRIRRVELSSGQVVTIAGTGAPGQADGSGATATFLGPSGIASAYGGILYVSDTTSGLIRRINQTGTSATSPSSYTVATIAGGGPAAPSSAPVAARTASFSAPHGLTMASGDTRYVYIADTGHACIQVLNTSNMTVFNLAGGSRGYRDGVASQAAFFSPISITPLSDRALAVADLDNYVVRLLYCAGLPNSSRVDDWAVTTLAGNGTRGAAGGGGNVASFMGPAWVTASGANTVWVADGALSALRRVTISNDYLVLLTGQGSGSPTPPPDTVRLANADGVTPNPAGDPHPYVACRPLNPLAPGQSATMDWWFVVPAGVKAFSFGVSVEAPSEGLAPLEAVSNLSGTGGGSPRVAVRTFAGSTTGVEGARNGGLAESLFGNINGLTTDADGNLLALQNYNIRPVYVGAGYTSEWAFPPGNSLQGWSIAADPRAPDCFFYTDAPVIDPFQDAHRGTRVRMATQSGGAITINTIQAGFTGLWVLAEDGEAAALWALQWWKAPENRSFLVQIRHVSGGSMADANPNDWTVSGYWLPPAYSAPHTPSVPWTVSSFGPSRTGMAVAPDGSIYCCSGQWEAVLRLRPQNFDPQLGSQVQVDVVAGALGTAGYRDGQGSAALFNDPTDLALDSSGYLYVTDCGNHRIRRVSPEGVVTTVAGTGVAGLSDGTGDTAMLQYPFCCALDSRGDLYVAEGLQVERIRRLSRIISTP